MWTPNSQKKNKKKIFFFFCNVTEVSMVTVTRLPGSEEQHGMAVCSVVKANLKRAEVRKGAVAQQMELCRL